VYHLLFWGFSARGLKPMKRKYVGWEDYKINGMWKLSCAFPSKDVASLPSHFPDFSFDQIFRMNLQLQIAQWKWCEDILRSCVNDKQTNKVHFVWWLRVVDTQIGITLSLCQTAREKINLCPESTHSTHFCGQPQNDNVLGNKSKQSGRERQELQSH